MENSRIRAAYVHSYAGIMTTSLSLPRDKLRGTPNYIRVDETFHRGLYNAIELYYAHPFVFQITGILAEPLEVPFEV